MQVRVRLNGVLLAEAPVMRAEWSDYFQYERYTNYIRAESKALLVSIEVVYLGRRAGEEEEEAKGTRVWLDDVQLEYYPH